LGLKFEKGRRNIRGKEKGKEAGMGVSVFPEEDFP
jgi:hypothetical protein